MIRRLSISPELWVQFLSRDVPMTFRVAKNALPSDAKCVRMDAVPCVGTRGLVALWIESAAFRDDDPLDLPDPLMTVVEMPARRNP